VLEALGKVIDYMFYDEERDYDATPSADHIFLDVRLLAQFWRALTSGRYVIVERKVLERMAELAGCADALLADAKGNQEEE
jgi:hypothetical protein